MTHFLRAVLIAMATVTAADAAVFRLVAEGTVYSAEFTSIAVGSDARFELVYDSAAPDTDGADGFGVYNDAVVSGSATFGGVTYSFASAERFAVFDSSLADALEFNSSRFDTVLIGANTGFGLYLQDNSGATFTSDALPTSLDLADFKIRQFSVSTPVGPNASFARATITSLTLTPVAPVPLPAGGALLLGALGVTALARRRRAQQRRRQTLRA